MFLEDTKKVGCPFTGELESSDVLQIIEYRRITRLSIFNDIFFFETIFFSNNSLKK